MSDDQLLEAYARSGDDDAFRLLVERHASMVYAIALRKTGNHETAKEVSQAVFAALARKARQLADHTAISRWLFRAAVYETAKAQRTEARRRQRLERLASARNHTQDTPPSDPDYEHLDQAIAALPDRYRTIVLLRFYEGQSFREIATATGKSEPAARMQMQRALEKLTALLQRHRRTAAAIAATAIAAELTARATYTISPQVLASITSTPFAPTTSANIISNTIAIMSKAKLIPAAGVAALAAIPLAALWKQNQNLRDQLGELRHQQQTRAASDHTQPTPPPDADPKSTTGAASVTLAASTSSKSSLTELWDAALFQPDPVKRQRLIAALLEDLGPDNVATVAEAFGNAREKGGQFDQEFALFLRAWAEFDGLAALTHTFDPDHGLQSTPASLAALGGWASSDPDAARQWVETIDEKNLREALVFGVLDGWSIRDFGAAAAYAESRPRSPSRDRFVGLLLQRSIMAGGIPEAQNWFDTIDNSDHNELYKRNAFDGIIRNMLYRDPSAAASWMASHSGQPYLNISHTVADIATKLAEADPVGAINWLTSLEGIPDQTGNHGADRIANHWTATNPNGVATWLGENQQHPHYDPMAARLANAFANASDDVAAGNAWATSISDPDRRRSTQLSIARSQLNKHGNEPEMISALLVAGLPADIVETAHKNPQQYANFASIGFPTEAGADQGISVVWDAAAPQQELNIGGLIRREKEAAASQIMIESRFIEVEQANDN